MDAVRGLRIVRNQMRLRGWKVIEVSGWETRGMNNPIIPKGAVNHWTAGSRTGNAPSLNVVVFGREGLRNALCHTYQDRQATLYIVAARVAWHAGVGSWPGLRGNIDCLGHEPECSGPGDWRPGQLDLMADLDIIQADVFGYPITKVIDHFEWATPKGRKSDRSDVGGLSWRARLLKDNDMPLTEAEIKKVAEETVNLLRATHFPIYHDGKNPDGTWKTEPYATLLGRIRSRGQEARDRVGAHLPVKYGGPTAQEIAKAIVNEMPQNAPIDIAIVEAGVIKALSRITSPL